MKKVSVVLPQLSSNMESAVLVSWEKQPGETVKSGDILYEVETDKVVSQVEAEHDGVLARQLVEEGDEVKPGEAVAEIEEE